MNKSWTEIVTEKVRGSMVAVTPLGEPFVILPIGNKESIELHFTIDGISLPFSIWFRRKDYEGNVTEERLYAQVGTRDLAAMNMVHVADLRINSLPVVLVEDGE